MRLRISNCEFKSKDSGDSRPTRRWGETETRRGPFVSAFLAVSPFHPFSASFRFCLQPQGLSLSKAAPPTSNSLPFAFRLEPFAFSLCPMPYAFSILFPTNLGIIKALTQSLYLLQQMTAKRTDPMTINDAAGIMTAKRNDGHVQWLNDQN